MSNSFDQNEQIGQKTSSQPFKNQNIQQHFHTLQPSKQSSSDRAQTGDDNRNKLPINFFHSSSEYNRMLITNGRQLRKQQNSFLSDGVIKNLEFINNDIFQQEFIRKSKYKEERIHSEVDKIKQNRTSIGSCICCCCDSFCKACMQLGSTVCEKQKEKIQNTQKLFKQVHINRSNSKKKKRKLYSKCDKQLKQCDIGKIQMSPIQMKAHHESKKDSSYHSNISHIVMKSLLKFEQNKRIEQIEKLKQSQKIQFQKEQLAFLNEQIRKLNKSKASKSKNRSKSASPAKSQYSKRFKYWESIKNNVFAELKAHKLNPQPKEKEQKSPKRPCIFSKEQIQLLRQKYERQAYLKIQKEMQKQMDKKQLIEANLEKVERQRLKRLKDCQKSPFKPTKEMINQAFRNQSFEKWTKEQQQKQKQNQQQSKPLKKRRK